MKCKNCGHEIVWDGLVHCEELDCECIHPDPTDPRSEGAVHRDKKNDRKREELRKWVESLDKEPEEKSQ